MVEKNTQKSLNTIPSINNDGQPYIIPLDIYKEGYTAYDLSNWIKARTGDNGTPFAIRWYSHGRLLNILGMRPFIEGEIGDYSIDDSNPNNPIINMAEDASHIHIVGDVEDAKEGGIAIYRLISQALPKSGIFYGKIGLMGTESDGTKIETSVDIIFKVLAGHMNMLGARKFYVSELEKAWLEFQTKLKKYDQIYAETTEAHAEQFKKDLEDELIDLNNKINTQIKLAQDSLTSMQASMNSNIATFNKLSASTASLQSQIDNKDIVTVSQHKSDLNKEATQREKSDNELLSKFENALDNFSTEDINSAPEIKDARISSKRLGGQTYKTLGEAIRAQINQLAQLQLEISNSVSSIRLQLKDNTFNLESLKIEVTEKLKNVVTLEGFEITDQNNNLITDEKENPILADQFVVKTDKNLTQLNVPADGAIVGHKFDLMKESIDKAALSNKPSLFGGDFMLSQSHPQPFLFTPEKGKDLGVVLAPSTNPNDFNSGMVESPSIFFDDKMQKYIMVYTAYDNNTAGTIGYAFSDNLIDWSDQGKLIGPSGISKNGDQYGCTGPCLIKYDDVYYLFYLGLNGSGYEGEPINLCLAKSIDLNKWTYEGVVIPIQSEIPWASGNIYHPNISRINGTWIIFFNANGVVDGQSAERTGYAYSSNLEGPYTVEPNRISQFAEEEGDKSTIQCGDPSIFKYNGLYYMFYFDIRNEEVVDRYAWTTPYEFPRGWRYGGKVINQNDTFSKVYAHKPFCIIQNNVLYHYYTAVGDQGRCIALQTFELN